MAYFMGQGEAEKNMAVIDLEIAVSRYAGPILGFSQPLKASNSLEQMVAELGMALSGFSPVKRGKQPSRVWEHLPRRRRDSVAGAGRRLRGHSKTSRLRLPHQAPPEGVWCDILRSQANTRRPSLHASSSLSRATPNCSSVAGCSVAHQVLFPQRFDPVPVPT